MKNMSHLLMQDFETAGKAVLSFLHERFGFGLWMITRTEGNDWIVLQTQDHGYGVSAGTVFRWSDSFCSEMVKGNGPRIAPDSAEVPAYVRAPIGQQVPIRAYVGIPLTYEDGRLFGTLCAIDPIQQPVSILKDQHLIELLASLLSVILRMELKRADHQREIERLELQVFTDPISKLYNRRAWDAFLSREESRCQRYGYFASVVVVQIKHQKAANERRSLLEADQVAQRCAQALGRAARKTDVLARLGSDKFGILAVECNAEQSEQLLKRLQTELQNQDLSVSIGHKTRDPATSLTEAWHKADLILFESPQDQT